MPISAEVELPAGHELLFAPVTQDLYNNATNIGITDLVISAVK